MINYKDMLAGRVDVLAVLEAIPVEEVARMQAALEANVHTVHYGYDDMPGDALDAGLSGLAAEIACHEEGKKAPAGPRRC